MNKFHFFSRILFICFFVSACTLRFVSEANIRIKVDSMEESKQVGESIINELGKANIRQKLLTSFAREQIEMIKDLELNNVTKTTLLSGGLKQIETVVTITIYYTDKNFNPEVIAH